jgi:LPXTG-motif cell wall-anchored protein
MGPMRLAHYMLATFALTLALGGHLPAQAALEGPRSSTGSPNITASPSTGLHDGQVLRVSVTGFPANKRVRFYECPTIVPPTANPCRNQGAVLPFADVDSTGSGTTQFTASSQPATGMNNPASLSCPHTCELLAYAPNTVGADVLAHMSITFGSPGQLPATGDSSIAVLGWFALLLLSLSVLPLRSPQDRDSTAA